MSKRTNSRSRGRSRRRAAQGNRKLQALRLNRGLSRNTLGERAGIHPNTIQNIETKANKPTERVSKALLRALRIPIKRINFVFPERSKKVL